MLAAAFLLIVRSLMKLLEELRKRGLDLTGNLQGTRIRKINSPNSDIEVVELKDSSKVAIKRPRFQGQGDEMLFVKVGSLE